MSLRREFDLYIGDTYAGSGDDPEFEAALDAQEILARLRILQNYQGSAREEDLYASFSIRPPTVYTPEHVFTNEVAAAVVDFFHRESAAGRRWESLNVLPFVSTSSFDRILEGAKSSGIFSSCEIYDAWDDHQHEQLVEIILRQFCRGNSSLEELEFSCPEGASLLGALDETLHDVSCGLKHLVLSFGGSPIRIPLINVVEGCHSLESLCFIGGSLDQDQGNRILNLVSTCPCLREIVLWSAEPMGDQFWSRFIPDQCNLDARKRLYRLCLPQCFLKHRPWQARPHERSLVTISEQDINKLLQVFPALGDLGGWLLGGSEASDVVVFSLRTTQLLAFNYAGRAQLDQSLRPRLWKPVLERVVKGARNGMVFLQREELMHQKRALVLSCQASVLFSLLKHDPTVLTPEACRVQPPSTSLLSVMGLL